MERRSPDTKIQRAEDGARRRKYYGGLFRTERTRRSHDGPHPPYTVVHISLSPRRCARPFYSVVTHVTALDTAFTKWEWLGSGSPIIFVGVRRDKASLLLPPLPGSNVSLNVLCIAPSLSNIFMPFCSFFP